MTKTRGKGATREMRRSTSPAQPGQGQGKGKGKGKTAGEEAHLPWARRNYLLLGLGGGAIVVGFLLLALGDKTVAPVLLVGAYLGLIPWGIVASAGKKGTAGPGASS